MRFQISIITTILLFTILFAGCGGSETPNNTANTPNSNTTANANIAKNINNPLATEKKPEEATTNNAPTFSPIINALNEALKKRDDAALKKIYSQKTLEYFESEMKSEGKKSMSEFIIEGDPVDKVPFETRNETITGDTAIADLKGGSIGVWTPIRFIKENGEWKVTNESPDIDKVKTAANNSAK